MYLETPPGSKEERGWSRQRRGTPVLEILPLILARRVQPGLRAALPAVYEAGRDYLTAFAEREKIFFWEDYDYTLTVWILYCSSNLSYFLQYCSTVLIQYHTLT